MNDRSNTRHASTRTPVDLYLDLLKKTLTNWVYGDTETVPAAPSRKPHKRRSFDLIQASGMRIVRPQPFDPELRRIGRDVPLDAHTMVGLTRLDNLQHCMETVLRDNVEGDFIETGVWRGGSTIFMRGLLEAHGIRDRKVWVADSFEGLPPPNEDKYPADRGDTFHTIDYLAVSLEEVKRNFERYGLLDDQVEFLKGWFKDTLPDAPIEKLAVARLDGDMYESTMDALSSLYPKVSPGGFIIIDDFGAVPSCCEAVQDYRKRHGIDDEIHTIDWTGAFWRRSASR